MSTLSTVTLGFLSTGTSSSAGYVPIDELEVVLADSTIEADIGEDVIEASLSSSIEIEIQEDELDTYGQ